MMRCRHRCHGRDGGEVARCGGGDDISLSSAS